MKSPNIRSKIFVFWIKVIVSTQELTRTSFEEKVERCDSLNFEVPFVKEEFMLCQILKEESMNLG